MFFQTNNSYYTIQADHRNNLKEIFYLKALILFLNPN